MVRADFTKKPCTARIIPVTIQHPPLADLEAVVQKSVPIGVKTPALLHRDLALRPTDIADLPVSQVNQMRDGQFRSLVMVVFYVVNFLIAGVDADDMRHLGKRILENGLSHVGHQDQPVKRC